MTSSGVRAEPRQGPSNADVYDAIGAAIGRAHRREVDPGQAYSDARRVVAAALVERDALVEQVAQAERREARVREALDVLGRQASMRAIGARAAGDFWRERAALDQQIVIERAAAALNEGDPDGQQQ